MKFWKCSKCFREHETKDNIIIVICGCCQIEMKPTPYNYKREVEVINYGEN